MDADAQASASDAPSTSLPELHQAGKRHARYHPDPRPPNAPGARPLQPKVVATDVIASVFPPAHNAHAPALVRVGIHPAGVPAPAAAIAVTGPDVSRDPC